jgi:hypothetical protein
MRFALGCHMAGLQAFRKMTRTAFANKRSGVASPRQAKWFAPASACAAATLGRRALAAAAGGRAPEARREFRCEGRGRKNLIEGVREFENRDCWEISGASLRLAKTTLLTNRTLARACR